jgi:hypothetical protein
MFKVVERIVLVETGNRRDKAAKLFSDRIRNLYLCRIAQLPSLFELREGDNLFDLVERVHEGPLASLIKIVLALAVAVGDDLLQQTKEDVHIPVDEAFCLVRKHSRRNDSLAELRVLVIGRIVDRTARLGRAIASARRSIFTVGRRIEPVSVELPYW